MDRLSREPIVAAVDFDGVIHRYSRGWYDGTIYDPPMPYAKESLTILRNHGVEILIYSVRAYNRVVLGRTELNQLKDMEKWLEVHGIPYSQIWTQPGKPLAHFYLDDRAIRFANWKFALEQIQDIVGKDLLGDSV